MKKSINAGKSSIEKEAMIEKNYGSVDGYEMYCQELRTDVQNAIRISRGVIKRGLSFRIPYEELVVLLLAYGIEVERHSAEEIASFYLGDSSSYVERFKDIKEKYSVENIAEIQEKVWQVLSTYEVEITEFTLS